MKKILFFIILIGLTNCKLNDVNKTHGSLNLDKKHKKLEINASNNKNKGARVQIIFPAA